KATAVLGYSEPQIQEIVAYVSGTNTLLGAPHVNRANLKARGLTDEELDKVENSLASVFELGLAFAPWVVGKEAYDRLGVTAEKMSQPGLSLLRHLGYSDAQIEEANDVIEDRTTIERAAYLREQHDP